LRGREEGWRKNSRRGRRGTESEAGRIGGWEVQELLVWSRGRKRRRWKMGRLGKTRKEEERARLEAEAREKHEREALAHLPPPKSP